MKNAGIKNDISIVLSGEAGQGLQTLEKLIAAAAKGNNYNVFTYSEFMSRVRGGNNSTEVRISSERRASFVDRIDLFVPLGKNSMSRFSNRISSSTFILGDKENIDPVFLDGGYTVIPMEFSRAAAELGGKIYANIIILGFLTSILSIEKKEVVDIVSGFFSSKEKFLEKNIRALEKGYELASNTKLSESISITPDPSVSRDYLLQGSDSIGLGALAGGCNFISSYPMSPSTSVLVFMAQHSDRFGIAVEQAEDEISAINMSLGAWYAGARAMVTTSGGGFALMTESLSLAGAVESPMVIHLAQRPGPATGLPTRTEQGDLLMALFSGHGEFPRIILAPGNFTNGMELSCHAFNMADKYQVPVFIITDQYFLDSYYNVKPVEMDNLEEQKYIIKTEKGYKRYSTEKNSVSSRGVPGYGEGFVCVDSDEHGQSGYITEDFNVRRAMVDKRMNKLKKIKNDIIPPRIIGNIDYDILVTCWGSTLNGVKEAVKETGREDTAILHFIQLYPLLDEIRGYYKKAKRNIIIENNSTAQFARLLSMEMGVVFDKKILKYNGMPFSVEELISEITDF